MLGSVKPNVEASVHRSFMNSLRKLFSAPRRRLSSFLAHRFGHAELVVGQLKDSDQEIQCLCVSDSRFRVHFYNLAFSSPPRRLRSWQAPLPKLRETFAKCEYDLALALVDKKWEESLNGAYSYRTGQSVRLDVDISAPWEQLTRTWSNKEQTARKIRKYSLSYRISHDPADLDHFYYHMNLPLIHKQFGGAASIDTIKDMKLWFEQGFLLMVVQGGKDVAAGLCKIEGDTTVFLRAGVLNADRQYVANGAQAAVYYFILQYAKERDMKKVNFLPSSSFVRDGVYSHKVGWGATASPYEKALQSLLIFLPVQNVKTTLFLEKNPVLVSGNNGTLDLLSGWSGPIEMLPSWKENLLKTSVAPGVDRLFVHTTSGIEVCDLRPIQAGVP